MGNDDLRKVYEEKLEKHIASQFLFHVGSNEAKRTKDLTSIIDNLKGQMDDYAKMNQEQSGLIQTLRNQIEEFNKKSEEEKAYLQSKIANLEEEIRTKGQVSPRNVK